MTIFEIIMTILNLIAVLLIPVVAVFVGQYLQERAQRRKDKMDIFKTLMINRVGWSVESTRALNIIDIVFSDDKNVRQAWSEYYHALCVKDPDEIQLKQMQQAQDKLLEKMAISLGYKDKITWETIQNPYVPKGMMEAMDQQQIIQKGQTELAKVAGAFAQMINTNAANQHQADRRIIPMPTLEWIGKDKVVNHHQKVPYRVLERGTAMTKPDSTTRTTAVRT